jgi:phosphate uptake regulator
MDTRKIQQVGGGTYTVSLPKEWATETGIEPGSIVSLHTHIDGTLLIEPDRESKERTPAVTLSLDDTDPRTIDTVLRAAYTAGLERAELDADALTDTQRRTVEQTVHALTGLTVSETTPETIRLRSLLDADEISIPQSIRQLQFTALSAHRDATAAVCGEAERDDPGAHDAQADRIYELIDRYAQRGLDSLSVMDSLGLTRGALFVHWTVARELNTVSDCARRIGHVNNRLDSASSSEFCDDFEQIAQRTRTLVRDAVGVVVDTGTVSAACQLCRECENIRETLRDLDRQLFDADDTDYRLTRALDELRRTTDSAERIATLGLRSELRDGLGTLSVSADDSHIAQ